MPAGSPGTSASRGRLCASEDRAAARGALDRAFAWLAAFEREVAPLAGSNDAAQVAAILARCVRKDDTVARLGGDEFIVMLEALAGDGREAAEQASAVGNKILAALNQRFQLGNSEHRTSVSIGVSLFGELADEPVDEPLRRADMAMYRAKLGGRNAVCFFDPSMQADVHARADVEAGLWVALEQRQFVLHYQPQVAADGTV